MNIPDRTHKGFYVAVGALSVAFLTLALIVYWVVFPYQILEIKNNPVPVKPPKLRIGETLKQKHNYCKYSDARGILRRVMIGETTKIGLPDQADVTPPICTEATLETEIPEQTPTGKYHIHYTMTYHVNPIKDIIEEWDSQPFTVLK